MVIIGIDPGTATTGYGIINKTKNGLKCLEYGTITTKPKLQEERLRQIYNEFSKLLKKYQPNILAIEQLYFFKNLKTVIPVSEAKGVILLRANKKKIKIIQITPLQVKMGICGYGRADKTQVQKMVKIILELDDAPKPDDAADALAIAIIGSRLTGLRHKKTN